MPRDDESEESIKLDDLSDHLSEEDESEGEDGVEEVEEDEEHEQLHPDAHINYRENFVDEVIGQYVGRDDESESAATASESYRAPTPGDWAGYNADRDRAALGLYPTISDPKLFMLRVKSGFARTICTQIMYKCLHRSSKGTDMMIKSVFCRDHLSEYIYIEAHRQAHVLNVISGLQGAWRKIKLIPVSEMPSTLAATRTTSDVKPMSWGRFRYGLHKGDLCRIIEIDDVKQAYVLHVIPRVDYDKLFDADSTTTNEGGFRVQKLKSRTRPMQRFFTDTYFGKTQVGKSYNGSLEEYSSKSNEKVVRVAGKTFTTTGHEVKVVRQNAINTDKHLVNLTTDEHLRFDLGRVPSTKQDFLRLKEIRQVDLQVGDNVRVTSGELKNTTGVVREIFQDATGTKYSVQPTNNVHLREVIPFTKDNIEKIIAEGTHVKVVTGGHKGESGMVVKVRDGMVSIFSSRSRDEFTVFMSDVIETDEVSRGVPKYGQFEVFELVKLRGSDFGMITKIENRHFTILTNLGRNIDASHAEIQEVLCSTQQSNTRKGKRQSALDRFGNEIMQGDMVKVISDKSLWEGKQAVIKHVYMDSVWLESHDVKLNMGFFVMTRQDVWQVGGDKRPQEVEYMVPETGKAAEAAKKLEEDKNKKKQREKRTRDTATFVGKRVRIIAGYHKSYLGIITGVHGVTARVELHTGELNVTVPLEHIKEIGFEDSLATEQQVLSRPKQAKKATDVMPAPGQFAQANLDDTASDVGTEAEWASAYSAFSDLQSRASSTASSRVLGERGSSVASSSGRKRPSRRLGGVKSEVVSTVSSAIGLVPITSAAEPLPIDNGEWWMIPRAIGIIKDGGALDGEEVLILRPSHIDLDSIVVKVLSSSTDREVPCAKLAVKIDIEEGSKVAIVNKPGEPPVKAFIGMYHGPSMDGAFVKNNATEQISSCDINRMVQLG